MGSLGAPVTPEQDFGDTEERGAVRGG